MVIFMLVHIDQAFRIVRRDQENEENDQDDTLDIDKNLLKLFLTRTKQFELEERNLGISIRIKTENLNKFLENGKKQQESIAENSNPIPGNSFSRIT